MIVVHPQDPGTRFLHLIYEGLEGIRFFDSPCQRPQILEAIREAPRDEMILLLGRGTPYGLLGGLIGDEDAELLRDRPNLVGIWHYASTFALRHGLKGFFSGMFISEWYEAEANGVKTDMGEIDDLCWNFSGMFGDLLRAGYPLESIAADLMKPDAYGCPNRELTLFNIGRLTYRRTGEEPLPVKEEGWGLDESWYDEQDALVVRGVAAISREIDRILWEEGSPISIEGAVDTVGRECLRLMMEREARRSPAHEPTQRELAARLRKAGLPCKREGPLFESATYVVHLPGKDYALRGLEEKRGAGVGMGQSPGYLARPVPVTVSPDDFLLVLTRFHNEVLPLIRPRLEDYCREARKRMIIHQIESVARENR